MNSQEPIDWTLTPEEILGLLQESFWRRQSRGRKKP